MKSIVVSTGLLGVVLVLAGESIDPPTYDVALVPDPHEALAIPAIDPNEIVANSCVRCHSDRRLTGNLSLEDFDIATAPESAEVVERMIRKLRAGMMPPPTARAPEGDTLLQLVELLESTLDAAAERNPNPGRRTSRRLTRRDLE